MSGLREFDAADAELAAAMKKTRSRRARPLIRIFLDAKCALLRSRWGERNPPQLLGMAAATAQLVTSPHVFEEARRNLELKRPTLLSGLDEIMRQVELSGGFREVSSSLPPQDVPVLAGAVGTGCSHLLDR